jgi:hypothetical protein
MIKTKNILLILLFLIILLFVYQHVFKKNSKQIEKYNLQSPKKFKTTESVTVFNKMIIGNSNGDLSSIGCPKGIIWLWSGSIENIPDGWALCNGENGTPDLRGKFVLGVNPNSKKNSNFMVNEMTAQGGEEKVKLEIKHLPRHNHPDNFNESGAGGDGIWYDSGGYRLIINSSKGFTGDDEPHNNMPPYFTLAYIMKTL